MNSKAAAWALRNKANFPIDRRDLKGESLEDRIVIRPRCYITLTLDHRVMDGHRANRFLQVLVERLERWKE